MARVTAAVKSAAAALTAVRASIVDDIRAGLVGEERAKFDLTMAQVSVGRLLNDLRGTFNDDEQSSKEQVAAFKGYLELQLPSFSYSSALKYMQAARTDDAVPGVAEALHGNIMSLQYLARFEEDHATDTIEQAKLIAEEQGSDKVTLPILKQAATMVVPSLKPDPAKEQQRERDAAARQLDKVCTGVASSVKAYLKIEAGCKPDDGKRLRALYLSALLVGGNNGPMSKTAAQKLLRHADTVKKEQNEQAADRANESRNRVQG